NKLAAGEQGEFNLLWHKGNLLLDDLDVLRAECDEEGKPMPASPRLKNDINAVVGLIRKSEIPAAADYMEGRLLVHERTGAEAATLFERARALMSHQPDLACQADLYLGQCYERLEEHTQMYKAFERVAQRDPNSVVAQVGMAMARTALGQEDGALEKYYVLMR